MTAYKLDNTVKHYAWGSPDLIPRLLGRENPEREPWAELWMGTHSEGPSTTVLEGKTVALSELVELPFLLKFLAAETPLSIQAHPDLNQAREGFERENKAGIAPSDPKRNYKDPSHKPEILCALGPFTAMAGFREPAETAAFLEQLEGAGALHAALDGGYGKFLSLLFALSKEERAALSAAVFRAGERAALSVKERASAGAPGAARPEEAWRLCGEFARLYPGDPGILSPLYLNMLELEPLDAIFIRAGLFHAYVRGFGVECMANSDNVLRGGLTPKHVDLEELFRVLSFEPCKPAVLKPVLLSGNADAGCYGYKTACGEFSLFLLRGTGGRAAELKAPGGAVAVVYEGTVTIPPDITLRPGESAYISRRTPGESLVFRSPEEGGFTLFAAVIPEDPAPRA
ncbi:MAG: mannose-6-phosphate isomerase, class I [Treponema sp.]|jgi:mannose-6-phosphate isomerase|nr:mannose-6-phosphate isomerase, class I [Treponema sp.]